MPQDPRIARAGVGGTAGDPLTGTLTPDTDVTITPLKPFVDLRADVALGPIGDGPATLDASGR